MCHIQLSLRMNFLVKIHPALTLQHIAAGLRRGSSSNIVDLLKKSTLPLRSESKVELCHSQPPPHQLNRQSRSLQNLNAVHCLSLDPFSSIPPEGSKSKLKTPLTPFKALRLSPGSQNVNLLSNIIDKGLEKTGAMMMQMLNILPNVNNNGSRTTSDEEDDDKDNVINHSYA